MVSLMRRPVVVGNWKMNGSGQIALGICSDLVASADLVQLIDVILCPPATLLTLVTEQLDGTKMQTGAQDVDKNSPGAHTGQISAELVKDSGASFVILGHSERRADQSESNELVAAKVATALSRGLTPIICVGETRQQRDQGNTETVVAGQLDAILEVNGIDAFKYSIVAYEPVWAIGTGLTATPEQAQAVHRFIRHRLSIHNNAVSKQCRLLYGGSMKPDNAAALMAQPDIDGGLIGGASLKSRDFLSICTTASHSAADRN